eukprot:1391575-Amorphochlora_amoeboformis.AAC.1
MVMCRIEIHAMARLAVKGFKQIFRYIHTYIYYVRTYAHTHIRTYVHTHIRTSALIGFGVSIGTGGGYFDVTIATGALEGKLTLALVQEGRLTLALVQEVSLTLLSVRSVKLSSVSGIHTGG